jgi:hypothetical protein
VQADAVLLLAEGVAQQAQLSRILGAVAGQDDVVRRHRVHRAGEQVGDVALGLDDIGEHRSGAAHGLTDR